MTIPQAKQKLIAWANSQIGYKEGTNNWNKYAENKELQKLYGWYPQSQPWCDLWVDTGFIECFGLELASKLTYQPIGKGSAACQYSAGFYSAHESFYDYPEVGDQIFFYYDDGINHTGIVVEVSGGVVYTVEGNTSDMVTRHAYGIGSAVIAGYGRPNWSAVVTNTTVIPETPVTPPAKQAETAKAAIELPVLKNGDKGEAVRFLQTVLPFHGSRYKCGVWGADGEFGNATQNAVEKFQKDKGLTVDSIVGEATWTALLKV